MSSKSQSKPTPQSAPAREAAPMEMEVKIHSLSTSGSVLANASITLNGCFAVRGIKVINGENGPFVSMPSYKGRDGYKDVCFPCTKEFHQQFNDTVVAAYRQELSQLPQRQQEAPQEQETPPAPTMTM